MTSRVARRRVPFPMILGLTGLWLLLNQSLAPGQIVLGLALATALSLVSAALLPARARLKRLDVVAMLVLVVLREIVRSNLGVARVVLGLVGGREVRSGFVRIPLELRDPYGLAALAVIVTSTPGTVWAGVSPEGDWLTLHVLDIRDDAEWIHYIKHHFERRLLQVFG